ncbi:cytochrome P450 302a1, mitochondrial-like [Artemia franciscana]|uniref:cytochrome P450 302a1, mitochondrial-like n=1 Tax=Artemia franciscana TaxID=6661 RepID=UPI0032DBC494
MKPLTSIKGPTSLPLIGTLLQYSRFGEYSFDHLDKSGLKKYERYGSMVYEQILPGVNLLFLYNPEDIESMFEQDGKFPSRRSHTALEKYRKDNANLYNTGGLLPTNGPEWRRLRLAFQKSLGTNQAIRGYLSAVDQVTSEFVDTVQEKKVYENFLEELSNVFLEFLGLVVFDTRLHAFTSPNGNSEAEKIKRATMKTNELILKTDNGPQLWKFFNTPAYKQLVSAQTDLEKTALKYITAKQDVTSRVDNSPKTLLESWLTSSDVDSKDVLAMVCDMLLAGIDTTSYTMGYTLYFLATNKQAQDILRSEVRSVISGSICEETLSSLPYLKACLKESMRLNPISIGVGRKAGKNVKIHGYEVPEGTVLVTQNQVSCRMSKFFSSPNSFKPERWIRGSPLYENVHPFLVLPFGYGIRSCIARRLAEQNMYVLLARIIQKYEVKWLGKELGCISKLINKPDQPLRFKFTKVGGA